MNICFQIQEQQQIIKRSKRIPNSKLKKMLETLQKNYGTNIHFASNKANHNCFDQIDTPDRRSSLYIPKSASAQSPPSDLHIEENRLKTFINWPHSFIYYTKLARTGFYFIGPVDKVKCYFCRVEIGRWEPDDDEIKEHQRWSPNCPLLKRRETINIPLDRAELDKLLPPISYDVCGTNPNDVYNIRYGAVSEGTILPTATTETTTIAPMFPEYAIELARLRSFADWPKTMKQRPEDLSDAGFFYTKTGDRVKCFSCGGGLRDWDEDDIPWEQHAQWFSKCEYLKLMKGQGYIDEIQATLNNEKKYESTLNEGVVTPAMSPVTSVSKVCENIKHNVNNKVAAVTAVSIPPQENEKCEPNDTKLCKICYTNEFNTAFFPCGHVVACAKCASSVDRCPMCRKSFERVMRVYFS